MNRSTILIGLLALAVAGPVAATTATFSNRADWLAQVSGVSNFDSGSQTVGTAATIGNGGLFDVNLQINGYGVDINDPLALMRANAGVGQNYYNWGTGAIIRTVDKTASNSVFARISFAAPVSAFGFEYGLGGCPAYFNGCYPGAAGTLTFRLGGDAPFNVSTVQQSSTVPGSLAFWGILSDTQTFSYIDVFVNDTNRYLVLDNIAQGSVAAPPPPPPTSETAEPGTLLQLALGGGMLLLARRRFSGQDQEV
jgi:hypothetical protein